MKQTKYILIINTLITCFTLFATEQDKTKPVSDDEGLEAIEAFAKSPANAEGKAAADIIWKIGADTNRFTILMWQEFIPASKVNPKPPEPIRRALITGYLAGNIKSQISHKTNANDSYAGVLQELQTYAKLKESDKTLRIPALDEFAELENKGQLKTHIADLLSRKNKSK